MTDPSSTLSVRWAAVSPAVRIVLERFSGTPSITQGGGSRAGMEQKAPKAQVGALITKRFLIQNFTFPQ